MMPQAVVSYGSTSVRVKLKKGALRALGYNTHPQAHDAVDAGAFASDRGLHGRVQAVVCDRDSGLGWPSEAGPTGYWRARV